MAKKNTTYRLHMQNKMMSDAKISFCVLVEMGKNQRNLKPNSLGLGSNMRRNMSWTWIRVDRYNGDVRHNKNQTSIQNTPPKCLPSLTITISCIVVQ
jgi:hypothetical protein